MVVLRLFPARLEASQAHQLPSLWGEGDVLLGGTVTGLHTHRPSHTQVDVAPPREAAGGAGDAPSQAEAMLRSL